MSNQVAHVFQVGWTLFRFIAVISSSIAAILSNLLPLFLNDLFSVGYLFFMIVFLCVGAVIFQGALAHLFNDYADFSSGTDAKSPAILSGGSRVIQKGMLRPKTVLQIGKWLAIFLFTIAVVMATFGRYDIAILMIIGIWAAVSYSLPPLQLSYRPFLGEWLSLFPSIFFIGVAGPWIMIGTIPVWAMQNAVINALVCMAWVMVHHIPDIDADRMATPIKRTSVVWFVGKLGLNWARFPAFLYLFMAGLVTIWLFPERVWAGLIVLGLLSFGLFLVIKINPKNDQQVTNNEKLLLLLAMIIAIALGIF